MSSIDNPSDHAPKPWYDFIPDPPIVEDGMLPNPVIEDIGSIADGDIWARSESLNLDFYKRGDRFWVKDSATGKWLNFLEAEKAAHEKSKANRLAYQAEVKTYNQMRPCVKIDP